MKTRKPNESLEEMNRGLKVFKEDKLKPHTVIDRTVDQKVRKTELPRRRR